MSGHLVGDTALLGMTRANSVECNAMQDLLFVISVTVRRILVMCIVTLDAGIVLWELWTGGQMPYSELRNQDVKSKVTGDGSIILDMKSLFHK